MAEANLSDFITYARSRNKEEICETFQGDEKL